MIIYGSTLSPFVRKTVAFATEKGIAPELVAAGMGRGGPAFEEASPFGKIPALRDPGADADGGDFTLADSSAIVHYLEARHPDPELIPAEPRARARVVWFDKFADTILVSAGSKLFFNRLVAPKLLGRAGDEAVATAAERDELPPIFDYLEAQIPASGFLVEDRITLADIAVAGPFVNLRHVGHVLDTRQYPRASDYVERILSRPSFADLIVAETKFVASLG